MAVQQVDAAASETAPSPCGAALGRGSPGPRCPQETPPTRRGWAGGSTRCFISFAQSQQRGRARARRTACCQPSPGSGKGSDVWARVPAGARSGRRGRGGTRGFVSPEERGSAGEARLCRRDGKPSAAARAQRGPTDAAGDPLQGIFAPSPALGSALPWANNCPCPLVPSRPLPKFQACLLGGTFQPAWASTWQSGSPVSWGSFTGNAVQTLRTSPRPLKCTTSQWEAQQERSPRDSAICFPNIFLLQKKILSNTLGITWLQKYAHLHIYCSRDWDLFPSISNVPLPSFFFLCCR